MINQLCKGGENDMRVEVLRKQRNIYVFCWPCLIVQKMLCVVSMLSNPVDKKRTTGGGFSSLRPALWRWLSHAKHHALPCSAVDPRKPIWVFPKIWVGPPNHPF